MIEFVGKFDSNVTKSLNGHQVKKLWWAYAVFSLLFIGIGVLGVLTPEDMSDVVFGVIMMVFGVLFTPLALLLTKLMQKKLDKSMSILSEETQEIFQFYPDKLVITQRKGEEFEAVTTAKYSYLYKVEETQTHYFLKISKVQSHVVSKENLTQGTIEELNTILYANLGTSFTRAK